MEKMTDRYLISISCGSKEEKVALATSIHDQLVGNEYYINNGVILNIDQPKTILLWVGDECKDLPIIKLDLNAMKKE